MERRPAAENEPNWIGVAGSSGRWTPRRLVEDGTIGNPPTGVHSRVEGRGEGRRTDADDEDNATSKCSRARTASRTDRRSGRSPRTRRPERVSGAGQAPLKSQNCFPPRDSRQFRSRRRNCRGRRRRPEAASIPFLGRASSAPTPNPGCGITAGQGAGKPGFLGRPSGHLKDRALRRSWPELVRSLRRTARALSHCWRAAAERYSAIGSNAPFVSTSCRRYRADRDSSGVCFFNDLLGMQPPAPPAWSAGRYQRFHLFVSTTRFPAHARINETGRRRAARPRSVVLPNQSRGAAGTC